MQSSLCALSREVRRAVVAIALVAAIGCERVVSPGARLRPNAPRLGDFTFRIAEVYNRDTVDMNDSLLIPFRVAEGENPCSYSSYLWVMRREGTFVVLWGVRDSGTSCQRQVFPIRNPGRGITPPVVNGVAYWDRFVAP